MSTLSAAEANRQFSALLRRVNRGETVTIASRGRPVAVLTAAGMAEPGCAAAREALLERLRGQLVAGAGTPSRGWSRDELYDGV